MSSKKTVKKVTKGVVRTARPLDEKTGYRVGSLGYEVGRAYLSATKYEKAIAAVEEVLKVAAKAKGKPTAEEYIHLRAISWVGFLKTRDAKIFKDLPKEEIKETVKS